MSAQPSSEHDAARIHPAVRFEIPDNEFAILARIVWPDEHGIHVAVDI
jgi:hypothetical protein